MKTGLITGTTELRLYVPAAEDGWFYVKMMTDPVTMAYNAPWFPPDGCVPNPEKEWKKLQEKWIHNTPQRFYAFLQRKSDGTFVGDVNYHRDPATDRWEMGIVIYAPERGKGYGRQGLRLLLAQAFRVDGIAALHNDFETTRGAAYHIHRAVGFRELGISDGIVHLQLTREQYLADIAYIPLDLKCFSSRYAVRRLCEADADEILALCRENTQFYEYCEAEATKEQILNDLRITPPGLPLSSKYYVGFYRDRMLVAVMDLIDGYPERETAFIGFFMMNKALQGRQLGSAIIQELAVYLKSIGKTTIRLGIDKGNPQSTHFWKKNGFAVIKEVDRGDWTVLVAEKKL